MTKPQKCKYMKTKHNWTPNDYDLQFPTQTIPENIPIENSANLTQRLQRKFPLTKKIHLDLNDTNIKYANYTAIHTTLNLTINNQTQEVKFL